MQFLLIARMFGFSKHSKPQKQDNPHHPQRKSSRRRATDTQIYMKREHIKSESGLCAMDAKTLKLLLAMEHSDKNKEFKNTLNKHPNHNHHDHQHSNNNCTQIVNDHICQVSNTFTPNGRYTQIICTTFTPYTKNKEETTITPKIKKKDANGQISTDDDTPPLPTIPTRATTRSSIAYKLGKSLLNMPTPKLTSHHFADNESEDGQESSDDDDEDDDDDDDLKEDIKDDDRKGHIAADSHEESTSDGNYVDNHLHDEDNETLENHAHCTPVTPQDMKEELSNLVKSESEKRYWKKSQENLEREIAIMHYQEHDQHEFIQRMFPDQKTMDTSDLSTATSFEQYESDKSNGLVLKELMDGDSTKHQRRPSNLFRKNSRGRWKMDDLDDQEASLKRQLMQLQQSIGGQKHSVRSIKRKQRSFHCKLQQQNTPTPSDYTLSSLSQI